MENRILVLDNEPVILEAIDLSLTFSGFQVRSLLSAENFFTMLADFEPHLIILDHMVRGDNGAEICKTLKNDSRTRNIPVIMLSAHPEAELMRDEYLFNAILLKPFDLSVLLDEINAFINPAPLID